MSQSSSAISMYSMSSYCNICFRGEIAIWMDCLWHIRFYVLQLTSPLNHLVYEL